MPPHITTRAFLSLLLMSALSCATPSSAPVNTDPQPETDSDPISVEDSEGSRPIAIDAIDHQVAFAADGTYTHRHSVIYLPKTAEEAESLGHIRVDYDPWREEAPQISARITQEDGALYELDPSTIDESPARETSRGMYSDTLSLLVPLPGVKANSQVELVVNRRTKVTSLAESKLVHLSLWHSGPTQSRSLSVSAPRDMALTWKLDGIEGQLKESHTKGERRLSLELGPLDPEKIKEFFIPDDTLPTAALLIAPAATWQELATRYDAIVDGEIEKSDVSEWVGGIINSGMSRREVISALLASIHGEIRYTGLEYGEGSVIPRSPDEIIAQGYGDCKDQATFLVALLRKAGIQAHVALLYAGFGRDMEPAVPSLNHFNHAIVYIPGDDPLWIDPTHRFMPVGQLALRDRGRWALVADEKTSSLIKTPPRSADSNIERARRVVYLPESGEGRILEFTDGEGDLGEDLRDNLFEVDQKDLREHLEGYVKDVYGAESLGEVKLGEMSQLTEPIHYEIEALNTQIAQTLLDEAFVILDESLLLDRGDLGYIVEFQEDDPRVHPLQMVHPYSVEVIYEIHPPEGFAPIDIPAPATIPFGPAALSRQYTWEDDTLLIKLSFNTGPEIYTPAEVDALIKAYNDWGESNRKVVIFKHRGQLLADQGALKEGIDTYHTLVKENPSSAYHHARLAQGLLNAGLGKPARDVAKDALELEPTHPLAHRIYALTYVYDALGSERLGSSPREETLHALREALEANPEDVILNYYLAETLIYPYAHIRPTEEEWEESAALMAANMKSEQATDDQARIFAQSQTLTYIYLNKAEVALEGLEEAELTYSMPGLVALCQAAMGESSTALQTIKDTTSGIEEEAQMLGTIMGQLVGQGRYDEVRALIRAGMVDAPPPLKMAYQQSLDRMATFKPYEFQGLDQSTPEALVYSLFVGSSYGEDISTLFAGEDLENFEFPDFLASAIKGQNSDLRRSTLLDIITSAMEIQTEGSDDLGYRVRMYLETMPDNQAQYLYIVPKAPGVYGIKGSSGNSIALASEAALRLKEGDVKGAKQWLSWIIEATSESQREAQGLNLWRSPLKETPEGLSVIAAAYRFPSDETLSTLKEGLEMDESRRVQQNIHEMLAIQNLYLENFEAVLEHVDATRELSEDPQHFFLLRAKALSKLNRLEDLKSDTASYLEDYPTEIAALSPLWRYYSDHQLFELEDEINQEMLAIKPNDPAALNNHAWMTLFGLADLDQGVERAQKSLRIRPNYSGTQHTLATLYAARGEPGLAIATLRLAVENREDQSLNPSDWLIIGLIAESLNLIDIAEDSYQKARIEGEAGASSTFLAQQRLDALAAPAPTP